MPQITFLALVVLGLAAARITRLVTRDTIFDRPRTAIRNRYPAAGDFVSKFERTRRRWITGRWAKKHGKPARITVYRSQPTQHDGQHTFYVTRGSYFGGLISCDWCTGVWVAAALALVVTLAPVGYLYVAVPFAIAEIVGLAAARE